MKKIMLIILLMLVLTGCSIVRIDTNSIENILNVILTKDNDLYNQVGQGYKYYLPGGVTYIGSDDLNDILYCNGTYYYLYIDAIDYYYQTENVYKINKDAYYSRKISKDDGFKYNGYLEITEEDNLYYMEFFYNYSKIEAMVKKDDINNAVLNASYILSTVKYNRNIIDLMLDDDYFTNKTGKYNDYNTKSDSGKFKLEKQNTMEEG